MDAKSDLAHAIVVMSYMDMLSDVAHTIVVTSYDLAHAIVMTYMHAS
jgi:hypothetical protein